jgi:membrane-associated protease RseP (regulator of RpoE activity)
MFAGSFMHFALAFVLLFGLAAGLGLADANTTAIGMVDSCVPASVSALDHASCKHPLGVSPARRAGLRAGDVVVSIAGTPVHTWVQLGSVIRRQPVGKPMTVVVDRGGRQVRVRITPAAVPHRSGAYLGIENTVAFRRASPASALAFAGSTFGEVLTSSAQAAEKLPAALPDLFAKNRAHTAAGGVSSVVGAADIAGQAVAASTNWRYAVASLLLIVISLNIFVGAFNLLPLLPLDGGHIAVIIFERVRSWLARLFGRPDPGLVDMQKLIPVSVGVFALLVGLSLILVAADILNPIHLTQ